MGRDDDGSDEIAGVDGDTRVCGIGTGCIGGGFCTSCGRLLCKHSQQRYLSSIGLVFLLVFLAHIYAAIDFFKCGDTSSADIYVFFAVGALYFACSLAWPIL